MSENRRLFKGSIGQKWNFESKNVLAVVWVGILGLLLEAGGRGCNRRRFLLVAFSEVGNTVAPSNKGWATSSGKAS